jgi:hypothetical protein
VARQDRQRERRRDVRQISRLGDWQSNQQEELTIQLQYRVRGGESFCPLRYEKCSITGDVEYPFPSRGRAA